MYIVADGFARDHGVWLYHCPAESFTDRNTWWAWGIGDDGNWAWNVDPTPLSGDLWGELSLRLIEGMKVLSGFNASTGNVEVRVTDDVTQVLAPETPVTVVATQETSSAKLRRLHRSRLHPGPGDHFGESVQYHHEQPVQRAAVRRQSQSLIQLIKETLARVASPQSPTSHLDPVDGDELRRLA